MHILNIKKYLISLLILCISAIVYSNTNMAVSKTTVGVSRVGIFSNEHTNKASEDPHTVGYTIRLYKDTNPLYFEPEKLFGEMTWIYGDGESLTLGRLENIQYNPSTRAISFNAKLSLGMEQLDNKASRPAHDWFEFIGTLYDHRLEGQLIHKSGYDMDKVLETQRVVLLDTKSHQIDRFIPNTPTSYEEWLKTPLEHEAQW